MWGNGPCPSCVQAESMGHSQLGQALLSVPMAWRFACHHYTHGHYCSEFNQLGKTMETACVLQYEGMGGQHKC